MNVTLRKIGNSEGVILPKFRPAPGSGEVTRFQPARPLLRRSSDANWRARLKGSVKLADAVAISPMLLVAAASADRRDR